MFLLSILSCESRPFWTWWCHGSSSCRFRLSAPCVASLSAKHQPAISQRWQNRKSWGQPKTSTLNKQQTLLLDALGFCCWEGLWIKAGTGIGRMSLRLASYLHRNLKGNSCKVCFKNFDTHFTKCHKLSKHASSSINTSIYHPKKRPWIIH